MYLHIGQDVMIRQQNIVAIVDSGLLEISVETRQFFERLRALGYVEGDHRLGKSLIITDQMIYVSRISASTLSHRGRLGWDQFDPESP